MHGFCVMSHYKAKHVVCMVNRTCSMLCVWVVCMGCVYGLCVWLIVHVACCVYGLCVWLIVHVAIQVFTCLQQV